MGKRPLGRPKYRWEDNIKMDLEEVRCGGMEWIELAQVRDRCVLNILNTVYTLRFFSILNAVCFMILTYLVPVLFTFYIFIQQI